MPRVSRNILGFSSLPVALLRSVMTPLSSSLSSLLTILSDSHSLHLSS